MIAYMDEPADLTGWLDRFSTVWVRVDDGAQHAWWPVDPDCGVVGERCHDWVAVDRHGPWLRADDALTRLAVDKVRRVAA